MSQHEPSLRNIIYISRLEKPQNVFPQTLVILGEVKKKEGGGGGGATRPGLVVRCLSQPGLEATWMLPE